MSFEDQPHTARRFVCLSCMRKPSVLVIFLTVFIDLIGFGIIVPFIPSYGEHFGAHGVVIGVIFACLLRDAVHLLADLGKAVRPPWPAPDPAHQHRGSRRYPTCCSRAAPAWRTTPLALWLMVASRLFAGHVRRQYHRGPGLHCRHHAAGRPLKADGAHRDGVRAGIHPRAVHRRPRA